MPLIMHGNWTVSVKEKKAAFAQRFVISGASSGNGTYLHTTPPVNVTGAVWSLKIQSNPSGAGWVDSEYQITFPVVVGSQYQFDIQSNDVWAGDKDFNDLVLTCATAVTQTDFLVYGNVSTYSGCWYNPCYRWAVVIESAKALAEALRYPGMREIIQKIDPKRLKVIEKKPFPEPDPPPFTPLIIPLQGEAYLPAKRGMVLKRVKPVRTALKNAPALPVEEAGTQMLRTFTLSPAVSAKLDIDRAYVGSLVGSLKPYCFTDPLVNVGLRFLEYDRTAAELAGGAYTGTGNREVLGEVATDRNGNYIFRFSRSLTAFFEEADIDLALGEDEVAQSMPDVIVQVLDATASGGVAHETAAYWNVPVIKRINICIPSSKWQNPTGCHGRPITHIGFIPVGKSSVVLDADGRVTCTDTSKPDIPQTQCAAWWGYLRMSACLGKYDSVPHYTIEHRAKVDGSWTAWKVFDETLNVDKWDSVNNEWVATKVGPFVHSLDLVSGGAKESVLAYDNIQGNMDWEGSQWFLKATINSSLHVYRSTPGTVQFRLKGYDTSGNQVASTVDTITLFFDNSNAEYDIDEVKMGSQNGGDCALFHLSGEPNPAVLTVKFKAAQSQGLLGSYGISVRKGNIGTVGITTSGASHAISGAYVHGGASPCNSFFGTLLPHDPSADIDGYVTAYIVPSSGNWLAESEPFCTFAVQLSLTIRRTDGHDDGHSDHGPIQYFLGIEQ